MKNKLVLTEDSIPADEVSFDIDDRGDYLGINAKSTVGGFPVYLTLPQAKELSKWLKKAIKELEKREVV